ncbi:MAG TPA: hypothetical protein VJO33_17165 [Gemmatimonadaceae bacterium]|nr:hypothetical protein [Gemmatimonadaceae bacterium]
MSYSASDVENDASREAESADYDQEAPKKSASKQDKANYTFNRWSRQREHYIGLFKLWSRCILFLLGKQWLEWSAQSRRYTPETNVPKWRQRPVTNLVFAVYRTAIAKLTKQRPSFDVVPPRTGDSEDREAAHLGEGLLQQLWRALKVPKLLAKCAGWVLATGNIAIHVYWDAEAGKAIPLTVPIQDENGQEMPCPCDENGQPYTDKDGNPDLDREPDLIFEGEVAAELWPPFMIRYNPEAKTKEEATEWYVGRLMPRATVARKYSVDENDLKGGTDDELEEIDDLIANAAGAVEILGLTSLAGDRHESIGARVLVIEYFGKPCDDYKQGRHWVVANKLMVQDEEPLPGSKDERFWPPAVDIDDVPVPGDPHAMGLLSQVVSLNREYNSLNGKIAEHNVTMAMGGKWIVSPEDKGLKITSDPAQKLESKGYANGKPPIQAEIKTLPEGVFKERQRILSDLQLVSGLGDVGMGQKPEGVSSGRGFLVLQEAVDSVLSPTLFNFEIGMQEVGRRFLVLAREHYREERILKVRGHNGRWEIRSFMGADLGDSIDVQVQIGSSFPWSKAARQDMVLQVIQGIAALPNIAPEITMAKISQMLDMGGINAFEPEADPDTTECLLEHAQFEEYNPDKGILTVPQPGFWQNHARHYDEHATLLKRDRQRFERWHPEAQQLFIQHMLATRQLIEQAAAGLAPAVGAGGVGGAMGGGGGQPKPVGIQGPPGADSAPPGGGQQNDASLTREDFSAAGQ